MVRAFGTITALLLVLLPATGRADATCARVHPASARLSCEAVVRAIQDDDGPAFVARLSARSVQHIDRHLPPGQRSVRTNRQTLSARIGARPRAFLRLGSPSDDVVRIVHHVREPNGDVPSFVRIEIRDVDTGTIASVALGGEGWTIDLVIVRESLAWRRRSQDRGEQARGGREEPP